MIHNILLYNSTRKIRWWIDLTSRDTPVSKDMSELFHASLIQFKSSGRFCDESQNWSRSILVSNFFKVILFYTERLAFDCTVQCQQVSIINNNLDNQEYKSFFVIRTRRHVILRGGPKRTFMIYHKETLIQYHVWSL